jgi:5'-nucleotidase
VPAPSRSRLVAVLAALVLVLGACGGDDGGTADPGTTTTEVAPGEGETTDDAEGPEPSEPLRILVTNDDGYDAEGLDSVAEALAELDDVEVTIVAPLDQQSGQGGRRTEGDLPTSDVETLSGRPVTAVEGFPTDAVRVAIDELDLDPHLVVSGNNEGQNVGPVVDISGTIGAARAGVARGVPALALSQGVGDPFDYDAAVPLLVDWVTERRDALLEGSAAVEVTSINIPSCDDGEPRGLLEAEVEGDREVGEAIGPQDCAAEEELEAGAGDVTALLAGYATLTVVPDEPDTEPEVFDPAGDPVPQP